MTHDEVRDAVLRVLGELAPEADPDALDDDVPLRDQVDLDSMDVLNLLVGVQEETGVEVPDREAGRLLTLADLIRYVAERAGGAPG